MFASWRSTREEPKRILVPRSIRLDSFPYRDLRHNTEEIWWSGRQWAVTAYGIERLDGTYPIEKTRLFENLPRYSWPEHMGGKTWADNDDFATAWLVAIALHGARGVDLRDALRRAHP